MTRTTVGGPRWERRRARMEAVLAAAWAVAGEHGLAAVSLHEVPDASASGSLAVRLRRLQGEAVRRDARARSVEATHRILQHVDQADTARFPLPFLRTVPGFEPRPDLLRRVGAAREWLIERLHAAGCATRPTSTSAPHGCGLSRAARGRRHRRGVGAGLHTDPFTLRLSGPAGGSTRRGTTGEVVEIDAVEFCRVLCGRAEPTGVLTHRLPL